MKITIATQHRSLVASYGAAMGTAVATFWGGVDTRAGVANPGAVAVVRDLASTPTTRKRHFQVLIPDSNPPV